MYRLSNDKKPVIFSDVDGTIYKNFELKPETLDDVKFAIKNGADFNICTGNPMQERILELSKKMSARYLLCSSGGEIYDVKAKKTLKTWTIKYDFLKDILEAIKDQKIQVIFWDQNDYFYLKDLKEFNQDIFKYHFISQKNIDTIPKKWNGEKINPIKIELYSIEHPLSNTYPQEMFKYIKHIKNIEVIVTFCNIEINAKNVNKGLAVKWLVENIYSDEKININDIMTIGDSNNDVPMLKLTNYSYAMANSTKLPLEVAKLFTSDVIQNGLGEAILDYLYRYKNLARKHMLHEFLEGDK
ncbi:HAD-IIB family hydrolase [Metamycoplasma phocicerebrale]|uniref:HAD-IIB family hydrolase n=1 Tax=Metamycoplasma phocicerebrale TaxID=142649 RepID=A0A3T0TTF3_9BACT|nr:HAD-IIB family hydrolase [Metamycoplasma phocicerebrale]AZZ65256.1 HAD-IIB family hydrolase [Metamycoplasma phocicerebrale]